MRGINKVILVGNVGKDPDVRYTPDGKAVANVSLATSESWKDKNSGEKVEKTEWHRLVFFGRLAEVVGEYVKKGSQIYAEGRLQTEKWTDKQGVERYTTKIVVSELQLLGGKSQPTSQQSEPAPHTPLANKHPSGDFEDDIPF